MFPRLLTRKDIEKFLGTMTSHRSLANLDSEEKGPERTRIGRKAVYTREDWAEWLAIRVTAQHPHSQGIFVLQPLITKTKENRMKFNETIDAKFAEMGLTEAQRSAAGLHILARFGAAIAISLMRGMVKRHMATCAW